MYISIVLGTVGVRDQKRGRGLLSVDPGTKKYPLDPSTVKNLIPVTDNQQVTKGIRQDSLVGTSETTRENPQLDNHKNTNPRDNE